MPQNVAAPVLPPANLGERKNATLPPPPSQSRIENPESGVRGSCPIPAWRLLGLSRPPSLQRVQFRPVITPSAEGARGRPRRETGSGQGSRRGSGTGAGAAVASSERADRGSEGRKGLSVQLRRAGRFREAPPAPSPPPGAGERESLPPRRALRLGTPRLPRSSGGGGGGSLGLAANHN